MKPLRISHCTATSAMGRGLDAHWEALRRARSGLAPRAGEGPACWIGEVAGLEQPLQGEHAEWDCRNHRLARLGLAQDGFLEAALRLSQRYGAARVGVFMGTSTSGIAQTEQAYAEAAAAGSAALPGWFDYRRSHNIGAIGEFVRLELGLQGPVLTISTACSSSAKVFASAQRAMQAGLCDAAVVGGVDSLCLTTLYGFNSLQLVSADICRPADAARNGISIGEAAGFALLEPDGNSAGPLLLGYGESSDAHHMSTPDPQGRGAAAAMSAALRRAGLSPQDIGYINLHGTGTQANDMAEDQGVFSVFGAATPCSSTKGWSGHTLGAAGILEAAISLLCLRHGFLPQSLTTQHKDPQLRSNILLQAGQAPLRHVLSNSFGFGGSNCSLLFGARV